MEEINMKRISMVMLIMMLSSFVITFTSCETDTDDLTGPINNSLPEVTKIEASSQTIPTETTIDVSVTAKNGDSYSWSADAGEFSAPSSAATSWTASGMSASAAVKLVCTVSNSAGSRSASVSVTAVILTQATHHWPFDTDKSDAIGSADAVGDLVTISGEAKIGDGCASFPGLEYGAEFDPAAVLLVPNDDGINTGPDAVYTITMWIKTEEPGYGTWARTVDGYWPGDYPDDLKMWAFFENYYGESLFRYVQQPWGRSDVEEAGYADGEWHHYTMVHNESDLYTFYVDGEEVGSGGLLYDVPTNPDAESSVFTLGGTSSWGGPSLSLLNGLMDDVKYFNVTLSISEITLLASQ
jgi:hypothetical protein